MKKKLAALFLAGLMLAAVLTGCGGTGNSDSGSGADAGSPEGADSGTSSGYRIGFSMPARDQFWTSMQGVMENTAKEKGIDFAVLDANSDVATQLSHVQTWAADGYDAVIVGLCNNDSAQDVLNAVGDMKVVFVNRQPNLDVLKDGEVVYVGTDETLYGTEQGNYLGNLFKEEGKTDINVVLFMGELGLDNVTKRTNSAKEALAANGLNVTYVYEATANWDRITAMNLFSQFMGSGQEVDAVVCNNDEMALGVIEAMKTTGSKEVFCPVVGIDATNVGCASVQSGDMACSVFQDPVAQGEGTILCALGLLEGTEIEGLENNYYNITPQLVTKDNVADFIK